MKNNEPRTESVEACPLLNYCVDDARLCGLGVCKGTRGDYHDCACYRHYLSQDVKMHGLETTRTKNRI